MESIITFTYYSKWNHGNDPCYEGGKTSSGFLSISPHPSRPDYTMLTCVTVIDKGVSLLALVHPCLCITQLNYKQTITLGALYPDRSTDLVCHQHHSVVLLFKWRERPTSPSCREILKDQERLKMYPTRVPWVSRSVRLSFDSWDLLQSPVLLVFSVSNHWGAA